MKFRMWMVVSGLLVVYLAVGLWTTSVSSKPVDIAGSALSSGQQGSMALERTWRQLRLPWENWEQIPGFLPKSSNSVYVSVEPQQSVYQPQDVSALLHFASAGNTVIFAVSQQDAVLQKLNVSVNPISEHTVRTLSGPHKKWSNTSFTTADELNGAGLQVAQKLWRDGQGNVLGAVFKQGNGSMVLWAAPSVWENGTIDKGDNFQFVWNLIGNRKVFWDEYGHGLSSQSLIKWMFHGWRLLALILFILALFLYLYKNLWRFGPVRNPQLEPPMQGTDFMDALAWQMTRPALRRNQYEHLVPLVQKRLAQHGRYRGVATIEAATKWIEARRAPELSAVWQAWMKLADAGYQAKRWREFLKLTRTLLKQAEDYREESTDSEARMGHEVRHTK
ncbi:DUF4350 domain-containing protein [Alicyclobacillus sp. SO9]|uniref:DUF4350 domain-containing protein n=1 Tax=Alicyclobacillus sp. SO9 TaxID=2665646 RepID=UPI0018E90023|nr:DUF4350 domain-containing protein [Alicyclobacillus sp. SO9]QQE77772.1 DUF4350 domain-containing protein [Alicyclobacillus sp. SO9]